MMKKILLMAVAITSMMTMYSCKSQKTLSEATTVAETTDDVEEIAPIQYVKPETPTSSAPVAEAPATTTPAKAVPDRTERVTVVNSSETNMLKGFNVIVGSFGSKTNAENQKNKMIGRGYKAFLVQNSSGMYRVVAAGFDTREAATAVRDRIRATYSTEQGTCAEAWLLIPQR